jgi:hypothetical protein
VCAADRQDRRTERETDEARDKDHSELIFFTKFNSKTPLIKKLQYQKNTTFFFIEKNTHPHMINV